MEMIFGKLSVSREQESTRHLPDHLYRLPTLESIRNHPGLIKSKSKSDKYDAAFQLDPHLERILSRLALMQDVRL
jgi:hypothetical protein